MSRTIAEAEALLRVPIQDRHQDLFGFRLGERGAHTSRTFMLSELEQVFAVVSPEASRVGYADAIVDGNVTGKRTAATRSLTNQRLGELYGLDPTVTLFRALRFYWSRDEEGRPLLALLCAIARDPLLRLTAPPVLSLAPGEELMRQSALDAVTEAAGHRLNESIIDKVVRNASSTWTQSGHLDGRVRKIRKPVKATPMAVAYALLLGYLLGLRGSRLFDTLWTAVLDANRDELTFLAMDAKRMGGLNIRHGGGVTEVDFGSVLTAEEVRESYGSN